MKLRSISLTNVRRFAGTTVRLDGLGDGLNLVTAPNEAGKSTVFEALQSLLFVPYRSGGAEARSLRPYAGGAPEVAAEVELAGTSYRITKRWLQRPSARVAELPSGRILAQDDEAERWIADRIAGDGPAELLWVRQGMLALEPEGRTPSEKAEQERLTRIRRDLLSSVARELDAITGGSRLDAIAARCEAAAGEIATGTGRPRAGGRWRAAEDEAAALRAEFASLDAECADLAADLAERAMVGAELESARDPAAARARTAAFEEAVREHAAAQLHRSRLDAVEEAKRAAALELAAAEADLARHDATVGHHADVEAAAMKAATAAREAAVALAAAETRATAADETATAARVAHAAACRVLDAAGRSARANEAAARAAALGDRLARVTELAGTIAAATAEAQAAAVSDADVTAGREAAVRLDRARMRLEAGAVMIAASYLPGVAARITIDGRPVEPDAPVACTGPIRLDLPGLGSLDLAPGGDAARAARDVEAAEAALRAILAPAGASNLADLVARADSRVAAEGRAAQARAELSGIAPEGVARLQDEVALAHEAAAGADPDAPDPTAAAEAEAVARAGLDTATAVLAEAREARLAAAHDATAAGDRAEAADRTLALAAGEIAALPARAGLADRLDACRKAATEVGGIAAELIRAMPDLGAAATRLAEEKAAAQAAETHRHELETRDAAFRARIETRAGAGIEERRDEIAGRLEEAEGRAAGYAAEARSLARLRDALAAARAAARERYLAPVADELAPLLGLVLDGAELRLHPTRLLPETLARDGVEEDLAQLSGGTREQIAILTRLAFARLLARSGRATPVILDDALVFADDIRLARLLAAIGTVATDVQIILLTCRERVFSDLPATRPTLSLAEIETADAV